MQDFRDQSMPGNIEQLAETKFHVGLAIIWQEFPRNQGRVAMCITFELYKIFWKLFQKVL